MRATEIDEILASPPRLALMASLADGRWRSFMDLKRDTGLADGNLHVQARRLTEAGYIQQRKSAHGRRTRTSYQATEAGSLKLRLHVQQLQAVLQEDEIVIRPNLPATVRTTTGFGDSTERERSLMKVAIGADHGGFALKPACPAG